MSVPSLDNPRGETFDRVIPTAGRPNKKGFHMPAPRIRFRFLWAVFMIVAFGSACSDSQPPTAAMAPNPTPVPGSDISGAWTGTYKTNDIVDCDANQVLVAQATFQQNGSQVTGMLTANGPCGLGYTFGGTLQGTVLAGGIAAPGFGGGTAQGTLSGGNLTMNVFNMYEFNMGQLQLHR
jgi:hypothetical protein